jgi:hypothetical protein
MGRDSFLIIQMQAELVGVEKAFLFKILANE